MAIIISLFFFVRCPRNRRGGIGGPPLPGLRLLGTHSDKHVVVGIAKVEFSRGQFLGRKALQESCGGEDVSKGLDPKFGSGK